MDRVNENGTSYHFAAKVEDGAKSGCQAIKSWGLWLRNIAETFFPSVSGYCAAKQMPPGDASRIAAEYLLDHERKTSTRDYTLNG